MDRRLDILIAEHVMGQKRIADCGLGDDKCPGRYEPMVRRPCLPNYSSDIAAAWEIVEKMREFNFLLWTQISPGGNYRAEVRQFAHVQDVGFYERVEFEEVADTAPLAICLAALKAKGIDIEAPTVSSEG